MIRNPDHAADVRDAGATPVLADVETATAGELADHLRGHEAVVWSAGAGGPGTPGGQVSREDVATVAAEVLTVPSSTGKVIEFINGSTPIRQAVRDV